MQVKYIAYGIAQIVRIMDKTTDKPIEVHADKLSDKGYKLYLGGDKSKHIGWVNVHSGVNVIEYLPEYENLSGNNNFLILQIGDSLRTECYGAYDRSMHKMPF